MKERWKQSNLHPTVLVSNKGRVFREKQILPSPSNGYALVSISGYSVPVHRLVADAFVRPLQPGEIVHHRDGDRTNNAASNLEIGNQTEHTRHHLSKLSHNDIELAAELHTSGMSLRRIGRRLGVSYQTVLNNLNLRKKRLAKQKEP